MFTHNNEIPIKVKLDYRSFRYENTQTVLMGSNFCLRGDDVHVQPSPNVLIPQSR